MLVMFSALSSARTGRNCSMRSAYAVASAARAFVVPDRLLPKAAAPCVVIGGGAWSCVPLFREIQQRQPQLAYSREKVTA
jgi:hypothetical protein